MLYVLGHVLDLITTYVVSPGLERETNVMVDVYGFGWSDILAMAVVTSVGTLAALRWMWPRLFDRFPATERSYGRFYRSLLYGTGSKPPRDGTEFATGALIGVICIAAYAAIATKLFTGIWNLSVLAFGVTTDHFLLLLVTKVCVAALVGLAMFFLYPYWLHRRYGRS